MPRQWRIPEGHELDALRQLLEKPFEWPPELVTGQDYTVLTDDADGLPSGGGAAELSVFFIPLAGDAVVTNEGGALRIRNFFGGGAHLPVYNALIILAEAIRLDRERREQ